ncbi:unnamed protein product, partial [Meganyctiphanes norvegica]
MIAQTVSTIHSLHNHDAWCMGPFNSHRVLCQFPKWWSLSTQFAGVAHPDSIMVATIKIAAVMATFFLVCLVQVAWAFSVDSANDAFNTRLDYASAYTKPVEESKPAENALSCDSNYLQCVPKDDCEDDPLKGTRQCPPMWKKIGGACYFISNPARIVFVRQMRTNRYPQDAYGCVMEHRFDAWCIYGPEAGPFESRRGSAHEQKQEWKFQWDATHTALIYIRLDGGKSNSNTAITSPSGQRLCLSIDRTGFTPATCYEQKNVVCKMGNFENRCEKSLGRCCWSPSYRYYYKNLGSLGSTNVESGTKGTCFVLFNGEMITCEKAYKELKNLPVFRIGKSIYYLNSADGGCDGTSEAIISSEEIHRTIVRFLMTVEKLNIKIKIGLLIKAIDTGSTILWVNGKSVSYYKNEYWAVGHPKMHGLSGCIMYAGTGTDGSGAYLWHTIESGAECVKPTHMVLCEVPIRNTDFQPEKTEKKEKSCGIRISGGVMGRSYSFGNDHEEARFGEWPWQAAILNTRNFHLGVGQEFSCSGVLISQDVVLTSAHCVRELRAETILVSLGDYDLEAVNQRKLLEPVFVKVRVKVAHPENDLAVLHLAESVKYLDFPHINVGCLPSQSILYAGGEWECFVTGWPQPVYGSGRKLQRVEVDFVARRLCRRQTRSDLYDAYGRLRYPYQRRNSINNRKKEPELLCVEPWEGNTCLADSSMLLVCKKNAVFNDDPFNLGDVEDSESSDQTIYGQQQGGIQTYTSESTKVINAYGKNRFNADKWYVIGVGHSSNSCRNPGYMVFTPVHESLSFIHSSIGETG